MDGDGDELALVDEHVVAVDAEAETVWTALSETLESSAAGAFARYARLVGCEPAASSGPRPLAVGSTLPGFRVAACSGPDELVLVGRHRFARYRLHFGVEPGVGGHTQLRAETRAAFPGLAGAVYRSLVIGTRGHAVVVRGLLRRVKHRAETVRGAAS